MHGCTSADLLLQPNPEAPSYCDLSAMGPAKECNKCMDKKSKIQYLEQKGLTIKAETRVLSFPLYKQQSPHLLTSVPGIKTQSYVTTFVHKGQ